MKQYEVNGKTFTQTRKSEIEVNAGGGSLSDAAEMFGARPIYALQTNFGEQGKYGMCEVGKQETTVFEKEGKVFERTGFQHFNGHFSGFKEGVYEVTFRELRAV